MANKKEKKVAKEKKPLTKSERSEIANRAVQARRENNPKWGAGIRAKEAEKQKKLKAKEKVLAS